MTASKHYKTMDIIGYLKSVLEDAKPYARMKLMVVGVQVQMESLTLSSFGKTSYAWIVSIKIFRGSEKQHYWNI